MNKIDKLIERWDALREAHPDMIWDDITTVATWDSTGGATRYRVRCVCPTNYSVCGVDLGTISMSRYIAILCGDAPSVGVDYTYLGLARKIGELERMDWTTLDDKAHAARAKRAKLQAEWQTTCDAANKPLSDDEWSQILDDTFNA